MPETHVVAMVLLVLLTTLSFALWIVWRRESRLVKAFRDTLTHVPQAAVSCPEQNDYRYESPVIVMAHRGLAQYATENTGAAIHLASLRGANGVEVDIRFTKDHVPVLHHDTTLERLALRRERIRDLNWDQLTRVTILPANQLMTLDRCITLFGARFEQIMLDLKDFRTGSPNTSHLCAIVNCLRKQDAVDRMLVDSASLECVRYLTSKGLRASWREPTLPPSEIRNSGVHHVSMASERAKTFYEEHGWNGLKVTVICPPTAEKALWFVERGVYALITDATDTTLDLLAERGHIVSRPVPRLTSTVLKK